MLCILQILAVQKGVEAVVMTPFPVGTMTQQFSKDLANKLLSEGKVLIFAGGIGHPFFSTDTVTALRASELEADAILFAKAIDGVYDSDPAVNPNAVKFDEIPCKDIVEKNLKVIDIAAANLCYEQKIPVVIFGLAEEKSVIRAANGEKNWYNSNSIIIIYLEVFMSEQTKVFEEKMKKSVSNLNSELLTIRAGRANPHVLDKVTVEYYGAESTYQSGC